MRRKLILISNDDGVEAEGIRQLTEMVRPLGDVVVCAPDAARSGSSMAFSCHTPLRLRTIHTEDGLHIYSCNGTPCDCVKLACEMLVERTPDIVLSGINHGDNAGVNAHYSGTIAVCFEAAMKHIPAVGFSSCKLPRQADFSALQPAVRGIVEKVLAHGLPDGVCLNVNAPDAETFAGLRLTRMGRGNWQHELEERTDPRQHKYWWVAGAFVSEEEASPPVPLSTAPLRLPPIGGREEYTTMPAEKAVGISYPSQHSPLPPIGGSWRGAMGSELGGEAGEAADLTLLRDGYITVTPLQIDLTAYAAMDTLREILQIT